MQTLVERLRSKRPLLLDGPTGTELAHRGVSTDMPLWSAAALLASPETVRQIHRDYLVAGAEVVTANTFRTHARNLGLKGKAEQAGQLTQLAVDIARRETGQTAWVAGSQAPLEDCYKPELTPSDRELEQEHRLMAENLAAAGVDVILAETHPTIREAVAATRAARDVGLPVMVSFVCGRDGRLLSGESLIDAAHAVLPLDPLAILVNCLPAETADRAVTELVATAGNVAVGVYANVGWKDASGSWVNSDSIDPAVYAGLAATWLASGARLIGGCCGTTPAHISRLRKLIDAGEDTVPNMGG